MNRRRTLALVGMVAVLGAAFAVPVRADEPGVPGSCKLHQKHVVNPGCIPAVEESVTAVVAPTTLPNLVPEPTTYVDVGRMPTHIDPFELVYGPPAGPLMLRFPTIARNDGDYALDLLGTPTIDPERWQASQCVSWIEAVCTQRADVGEIAWHPQHNHFHFDDFARYELRRLADDGSPDFTDNGLLAESPKVSFCLQDTLQRDPSASPVPRYSGCPGVSQGISPGWADEYGPGLPGQSLSIAGLADGVYALVIILDPGNRLIETVESDNTTVARVELYNNGTSAQVVSP